jgi:integrase
MARSVSDYDTTSKKARLKLAPRDKPYNRHAGAKRIGYIRRAERNGLWLAIETVAGTKNVRTRVIAQADDFTPADGVDVLVFADALEKVATMGSFTQGPAVANHGRMTVGHAIEQYYASSKRALEMGEKKAAVNRRMVEAHLREGKGLELRATQVNRLTKAQVEAWFVDCATIARAEGWSDEAFARRQKAAKATANRYMNNLRAALNWAYESDAAGIRSDAAWKKVQRFAGVETARDQDVSPAQVLAWVEAAATLDHAVAALIEGTYLIGCRAPGEMAVLRVRDFDPVNGTLAIPKCKTDARTVYLSDEAVAFFKRMARNKLPEALLVPRSDGNRWLEKQHIPELAAARQLAQLPQGVTLYTLRHAHISRALEAGGGKNLKLVADNCGTSLAMMDRHYAKVSAEARREMTQSYAPKLRAA